VGWHLAFNWRKRLGLLNIADCEASSILLLVMFLGKTVDTSDLKCSSVSNQGSIWENLVAGEVSVSNKALAWLVDREGLRQFLSSEINGETVTAIVCEVDFVDLHGVVREEVVPDVLVLIASCEESEHFSIVVQELLL
jgi:hypothetical protein